MNNRKTNALFLWGALLILTLFVTINFCGEYQKEIGILVESSQRIFREAVQENTDRRCKAEGERFNFSYSSAFNEDTIEVTRADTTFYIKGNREAARAMSDKEKIDFGIELSLAFENPIQATSLDSLFQSLLAREQITARTAVVYTYDGKSEYSCPDSSFYQSAEALEEIAFGPARTIVLRGFVKIPFYYKVAKAISSDVLFLLVWGMALSAVLWLTFGKRGRRVQIIPVREAPKTMIEITPGLLLDETHGILRSKDHQVELINYRLKLFIALLENKGCHVDTDTLKEMLWPDGSVSKDALSSTVKRLKEDLSPFPEIAIESAQGKGYALCIDEGTNEAIADTDIP